MPLSSKLGRTSSCYSMNEIDLSLFFERIVNTSRSIELRLKLHCSNADMRDIMRNSLFQIADRAALTKYLICLLIITVSAGSATAATVSFQRFSVEIPDGWNHTIDELPANNQGFGATVSIYWPGDSGELTIVSYDSPEIVDELTLRNFTNVDSSVQLGLKEWGDFVGYRYSYSENGSHFRQWWLSNRTTILILVFVSASEVTPEEIQVVDRMVASIGDVSKTR